MIRSFRNLAALVFLLSVAFVPVSTEAAVSECEATWYRCGGDNVDFTNCEESCTELFDNCSSYCGGGFWEFYCEGEPGSTSGWCDCAPLCMGG